MCYFNSVTRLVFCSSFVALCSHVLISKKHSMLNRVSLKPIKTKCRSNNDLKVSNMDTSKFSCALWNWIQSSLNTSRLITDPYFISRSLASNYVLKFTVFDPLIKSNMVDVWYFRNSHNWLMGNQFKCLGSFATP